MAATNFFESLVLDHALRQAPFSITDWYAALWNSDPTPAGLLAGEVSNAEYLRIAVSWDSNFSNTTLLSWPTATSNWGDITHVCLLNNPNKGQGNMFIFEEYNPPLEVVAGKVVEIIAGELVVTLI